MLRGLVSVHGFVLTPCFGDKRATPVFLERQRRYEALEQRDEPFAGQSDGGDNGQCDGRADEAVFDGGGAVGVAQKLLKHAFSPEL